MNERIAKLIIEKRWYILTIIVILMMLSLYSATKVALRTKFSDLLPSKHRYIKLHKEIESSFGGANLVLIEIAVQEGTIFNYEALKKLRYITDEVAFVKGVDRFKVMSLASKKVRNVVVTAESIDTPPIMWPHIPKTEEEMAILKDALYANDLYYGVLVSLDSKAALIFVDFYAEELDYPRVFSQLQDIREKMRDANTTVSIIGEPMVRGFVSSFLKQTFSIFLITVIAMIILLWLYTRSFQHTVMPVLSAIVSTIYGLGFIGFMGYDIEPLTLVLPLLISARILSHSVQFNERFVGEYQLRGDIKSACKASIESLFVPGLVGIVTDAAGILVIYAVPIPILQKVALVCAYWGMTGIISVLFLNPIIITIMGNILVSKTEPAKVKEKKDTVFVKLLTKVGKICHTKERSWTVIAITIIIGVGALYFQKSLSVGEARPGNPIFWPDFIYNQDSTRINMHFLGTDNLKIVLMGKEPGAIKHKEVTEKVEEFIRELSMLPEVGGCISYVDYIKKLGTIWHSSYPKWELIPEETDNIGNILFLVEGSTGEPGSWDNYWKSNHQDAVINVYLKDHRGDSIRNVLNFAQKFVVEEGSFKLGKFELAGGLIGILGAVNEEVFNSQIMLLVLSFLLTFLCCAVAFRSIVAGIFLIIPLAVANYLVFAYMGLMRIGLNVNTLPVASIAIGIGVDYGVYLLARFCEIYKETEDLEQTISTAIITTGKAVTFTALTVAAGVFFWSFSGLRFQAEMGLLLTLVTIFHLIGTLTLLPALVFIARPRFICGAKNQHNKMKPFSNSLTCICVVIVLSCLAICGCSDTKKPKESTQGPIISYYDNLYDLAAIDSNMWAIGYYGTIVHSNDGGNTWERQTSTTRKALRGVYFVDSLNGWGVGERGLVINTKNGGKTWEPQISGTENHLFSVFFRDKNIGWIVGTYGTILYTQDGGVTWKSQSKSVDRDINSVYFIDGKNGWVVGEFGTILRTMDGGVTWNEQTYEKTERLKAEKPSEIKAKKPIWLDEEEELIGIGKPTFFDIIFSGGRGWIIGLNGIILISEDRGNTWKEIETPTKLPLFSICVSDSYGWIVGDKGIFLTSKDNGITWKEEKGIVESKYWLGKIVVPDMPSIGWLVGAHGRIYRSNHPNGNKWELVLHP